MQDANGTRFHLLLGEADWRRARPPDGEPAFPPDDSASAKAPRRVQWNASRGDVTLWKDTFRFSGSRSERPVSLDDRRGAARDRFGNWYWIAADRQSILVWSSGSAATSTFWPASAECGCEPQRPQDGGFRALAQPAPPVPLTLGGLTVTEDHYLVVGTLTSAHTRPGLLLFDLYAGNPPRHRQWPVSFEPFDLDARSGGGVWVLDRTGHRVWEIDRRFEVVALNGTTCSSPLTSPFSNADGSDSRQAAVARAPIALAQAWPVAAIDPIGIAACPAGGVLVLDRDGGDRFARIYWLDQGTARGAAVSTILLNAHIAVDDGMPPFTLVAHDFALGARGADDPPEWLGRLFVVGPDGNQAYAFGLSLAQGQLALHPLTDYYPMRLFGARALVSAAGEPWYDSGDAWLKLVAQDRPRYADDGELWTPVFDSGQPGCVWHRLMIDACVPHSTDIDVWTRSSDEWRELTLVDWLSAAERKALGAPPLPQPDDPASASELAAWQPEPAPRPRSTGSELPYLDTPLGSSWATHELLFQRARGRYLQVRLVLRGDGRSTPRIRALRAWYPRFSYLERYLPAVYRDDAPSSSFLDRFLANFEGTFTAIEDRIAAAQMLFDVATAPRDALDWLGTWFGVAFDPSWEDARRRLFLRHATDFFAVRGTIRGLQLALHLALDECVDDRLFTDSSAAARRAAAVRIVERFRTRRTPPALLGSVTTAVPGPKRIDPSERWQPSAGADELHRRYREALGLAADQRFPLAPGDPSDEWTQFAAETLGFVPAASRTELRKWQQFLRRKYGTTSSLPRDYGGPAQFDDVRLPADRPTSSSISADWNAFFEEPTRTRQLWHDFLARRYRSVIDLNAAWRTHWTSFSTTALPDTVPGDVAPLSDWFQFEGTALAMQRTAHRFTVLLPVPKAMRTDTPAQQRRIALAQTILDLEKPAHTSYDLRFYWAMFRLGEARLGDDTLIDLGSRAPELMAPMVLGQGYLGEAFLSAPAGREAPDRIEIGRDRVGRSTRLGGP